MSDTVGKKIEEYELSDRLTQRLPSLDQGLEIAKLMTEGIDRDRLAASMAIVWKIAHCTLFVVSEDHPEAPRS